MSLAVFFSLGTGLFSSQTVELGREDAVRAGARQVSPASKIDRLREQTELSRTDEDAIIDSNRAKRVVSTQP